jgi:hypothetical protein
MLNEDDVIANQVYLQLYDQLRGRQDVANLSELSGVPQNILYQMLSQKLSRGVRKSFHRIKAQIRRFSAEWRQGKTFAQLAQEIDFSPLMMARLILFDSGWTKIQFTRAMREPQKVPDQRIRKELEECLEFDPVFSPAAQNRAAASGRDLEEKVGKWLAEKGITFVTEKQNTQYQKTPDFLLDSPQEILGEKAYWIECKSSFGDEIETRRNLNKQVSHYLKLFGPGVIVYGLGIVEKPHTLPGIRVVSRKMLLGNSPSPQPQ